MFDLTVRRFQSDGRRRAGHKNIVYIDNIAAKMHNPKLGEKEFEEFRGAITIIRREICWVTEKG